MKTAIIIADGIKQIMFTPENDSEKQAIKLITSDHNVSVEFKETRFYNDGQSPECARGYIIEKSAGGPLRAYENEESLMLVLTPRIKEING